MAEQDKRDHQTRERVYQFIVQYKLDNDGLSPSIRQIMMNVHLATTSAVYHHLETLEKAGRIERRGEKCSGILIPGAHWIAPEMPL